MSDSIHADTVRREKREAERVEFLKACAIAALRASRAYQDKTDMVLRQRTIGGDAWAKAVVADASSLWSAIEATRGEQK